MKQDATFIETSAYGSDAWCAVTLGKSLHWFRKNRETLEREGFPKRDMLVGQTLKADVEAWLAKRRRVLSQGSIDLEATARNLENATRAELALLSGGKRNTTTRGEKLENL